MSRFPWSSLSLDQLRSEVSRFEQQMERLLGGRGTTAKAPFEQTVAPLLNLWEDDDKLYVEAELPGLEMDDLAIYVTGESRLSISGERKRPGQEGGTWHRQERSYGRFSRAVELPYPVDNNKVTAQFKNGVLTVSLPKRSEAKPRLIQVKSS